MTRFKNELERVLKSTGDRDTGIILREICDLAAEMGDETAEALLARHGLELPWPARPVGDVELADTLFEGALTAWCVSLSGCSTYNGPDWLFVDD